MSEAKEASGGRKRWWPYFAVIVLILVVVRAVNTVRAPRFTPSFRSSFEVVLESALKREGVWEEATNRFRDNPGGGLLAVRRGLARMNHSERLSRGRFLVEHLHPRLSGQHCADVASGIGQWETSSATIRLLPRDSVDVWAGIVARSFRLEMDHQPHRVRPTDDDFDVLWGEVFDELDDPDFERLNTIMDQWERGVPSLQPADICWAYKTLWRTTLSLAEGGKEKPLQVLTVWEYMD